MQPGQSQRQVDFCPPALLLWHDGITGPLIAVVALLKRWELWEHRRQTRAQFGIIFAEAMILRACKRRAKPHFAGFKSLEVAFCQQALALQAMAREKCSLIRCRHGANIGDRGVCGVRRALYPDAGPSWPGLPNLTNLWIYHHFLNLLYVVPAGFVNREGGMPQFLISPLRHYRRSRYGYLGFDVLFEALWIYPALTMRLLLVEASVLFWPDSYSPCYSGRGADWCAFACKGLALKS